MYVEENGGIVLEASILMPFFLAFVLSLASVIKLTVTDLALQHALSETTKQMAAHSYPVELLAEEVRQAYGQSRVSGAVDAVLSRVKSVRDTVLTGEQWVRDYEAFIPDFLISWVEWEQRKRESMEQMGQDQYELFLKEHVDPVIHAAFRQAVMKHADPKAIDGAKLRVTNVQLPELGSKEKAYLGIEAEYDVRLPVPFFRKTITLRKQAYERIWTAA